MNYTQFIAGEFLDGSGTSKFSVINPTDGTALGDYTCASDNDIQSAITSAAKAFQTWRHTPILERASLLRRTASLIRERTDILAKQITLELGKPYSGSQAEARTAAEMFEWASEELRRTYGRTIPSRSKHITQTVALEPIGPVGAICPWNSPSVSPSRKISCSLAAGCTIVIKPSEETAGVALILAQALKDAGVPPGVVNMVFGDPARIAEALCAAPEIAMVSFTGATEIGKQIGAMAARTMKRCTLELGGHAPVIVCEDADILRVAKAGAASKFRNGGQVCTAPTRFLVHSDVFDDFRGAFLAAARTIQVGDPFDPATQMGPLKNDRRVTSVENLIRDAEQHGALISTGGKRIGGEGYFFEPTVIEYPSLDCGVSHIEPFGPIALLSPFNDIDEALSEANRLPFGLASYAFTNNLAYAHRLSNEIAAGVVCINEWSASLPETPFGGYKDSGLGYEGGIEGVTQFLRTKCVRLGASF